MGEKIKEKRTVVNRKLEKHKEIELEIVSLKTEYINQETDDVEMGGTVYTEWHKTVKQVEQKNLE